ncbi:hypothetical protein [Mesorhizobium sangaii]|uniref:Uncharacterized protein n=1 Tax=Mesorhizobium sangaii TaxID=505389 RepID=A0A841PU47_9HYPH|nr:hypothetical protein [Mesorhizobium sangaii]MBB6414070.1 hypothetical protein [Mesorhizobium sangaii]
MSKFTIETTYRLPVYRQRAYEAATLEDACLLAIDDDGWGDAKEDVDTSGETYVTGIWSGADAAHRGEAAAIPSQFRETVQRKAEHFRDLLDQLAYVAQPTGLSMVDFERWLPNAIAAVEKGRAIIEERSNPDEQN